MVDDVRKMSWDDLRIVKAVGEAGSLARTGAALGANASTIFRRLARIERLLGVKLFVRRRDGYVPTAVGTDLVRLATRIEDELLSLTHRFAAQEQGASGELRIATNEWLSYHLVTPVVADFLAVYPNVRIQVFVVNTAAKLDKGVADVAIQMTQQPTQRMTGRKVAVIGWAAYGRRTDTRCAGVVAGEAHPRRWVAYVEELGDTKAARYLRKNIDAGAISFRTNSVHSVAAAIEAGLGFGYLPSMLGDRLPSLTRIGSLDVTLSEELWLLTHPEIEKLEAVRAFFDFFTTAIDSQRAAIAGVDTHRY